MGPSIAEQLAMDPFQCVIKSWALKTANGGVRSVYCQLTSQLMFYMRQAGMVSVHTTKENL